jgi:hypothetical protein
MPCWCTLEQPLGMKNLNRDVVIATATALGYENFDDLGNGQFSMDHFGYRSSIVFRNGEVTVVTGINGLGKQIELDKRTNQFAQGYSKEAVKVAAKKFGFQLAWKSETKFQLQKRGL